MNDKWEKRLIETYVFGIQVVSSIRKQGFLKTKILIKFSHSVGDTGVSVVFVIIVVVPVLRQGFSLAQDGLELSIPYSLVWSS